MASICVPGAQAGLFRVTQPNGFRSGEAHALQAQTGTFHTKPKGRLTMQESFSQACELQRKSLFLFPKSTAAYEVFTT